MELDYILLDREPFIQGHCLEDPLNHRKVLFVLVSILLLVQLPETLEPPLDLLVGGHEL